MIQINLQWLAYPCWVAAAWWLVSGLYAVISMAGTSDIGPMIGVGVGVRNGFFALCAGALGFLIWRAFRSA